MTDTVARACKCCQRATQQQRIPSVSPGHIYYACTSCGSVTHESAKQEAS